MQSYLEHYKKIIIHNLINKKEEIANEINDIASYIDTLYDLTDLTSEEITVINEKRKEMLFIYKLIDKIEDIKEI